MRKKILTNYILVLIMSSILIGTLSFCLINDSYTKTKLEKYNTSFKLIDSIINEEKEDINLYKLSQVLEKAVGSRITILDSDGNPVSDSLNNSIVLKEFKSSHKKYFNENIFKEYSPESGKKYFYMIGGAFSINDEIYRVRIGDTYDHVDYLRDRFIRYMFVSLAIGILFSIILSYTFVGGIVNPIRELNVVSKEIANGNFNAKLSYDQDDEIGELAKNFGIMQEKLDENIQNIKKKNLEMDIILRNIEDGIMSIDKNNKPVLINRSGQEILNIEGLKNREKLDRIISSEDKYGEINLKNKLISVEKIDIKEESNGEGNKLVIFKDISSQRKLENMKKDFASNVSHELRTPLTSIQGFIEILKYSRLDLDQRGKALDIMELETERLKKLINKMLEISMIESINNKREFELIRVQKEVLEVIDLLKPQLSNKNIGLEIDLPEEAIFIKADLELFHQLLINIVENSIKYNRENGKIILSLEKNKDHVAINVEDTGIGISEEDLTMVFEKFYRADKSRSQRVEGSGLGLSIAETIVEYFEGEILIESELALGTKVNLKFKS